MMNPYDVSGAPSSLAVALLTGVKRILVACVSRILPRIYKADFLSRSRPGEQLVERRHLFVHAHSNLDLEAPLLLGLDTSPALFFPHPRFVVLIFSSGIPLVISPLLPRATLSCPLSNMVLSNSGACFPSLSFRNRFFFRPSDASRGLQCFFLEHSFFSHPTAMRVSPFTVALPKGWIEHAWVSYGFGVKRILHRSPRCVPSQ